MEIENNQKRRDRKKKVLLFSTASSLALLFIVTFIVVFMRSMPPFSDSYTYDVYYRENIVGLGGAATADGLSLSFHDLSVLAYKDDRVLLSLLVDGKEYLIANITPSTLKAIVSDGETIVEYIDDRNILWITIDNSESDSLNSYGITVTFDNKKVSTIDLFQNTRTEVESKYRIAIEGQLIPALPTDHKEMEKILGKAISIEKQRKY